MFVDCLDQASMTWLTGGPTVMATVPTAHMAVAAGTRMHMEKQCSTLRVVDPFTDDGVWAIIDDACNSCCHGELWRKNAELNWAKLGLKPEWVHLRAISFSGVGKRITAGWP